MVHDREKIAISSRMLPEVDGKTAPFKHNIGP